MKIKDVATQFQLTADTLRYYEKIGLLDPVKKDKSGKRDYQEKDLKRLEFVCCMRDAGLNIQVLLDYISLYRQGDQTIEERKNLLVQQRQQLLLKRESIDYSINKLDYKIQNYEKWLNNKEDL